MNSELLVSDGVEETIQRFLKNTPSSEIFCINLQKVVDSSSITLEDALDEELEWLGYSRSTSFGELSVIKNTFAISLIGKSVQNTVVRIFIDSMNQVFPNALNVEIITKTKSLFYRPIGQCIGYASYTQSGGISSHFITNRSMISEIEKCPKPSITLKLGIMSLDHPHSEGNHLPALKNMKDYVTVTSIYNSDAVRAKPWCDFFSAEYFDEIDNFLNNVNMDAVLITSINSEHYDAIKKVAMSNKDIFCDKPIVIRKEHLSEIQNICNKSGIQFITTYPVRHHPAILLIRELIKENKFGEIVAIMATNHGCMYAPDTPDWVKDPLQNGGGSIIDHTVHIADTIRFLTQLEFKDIYTIASSRIHDIPSEDISISHGRMENGTLFQIDSSWSRKASDPVWGDVTFRIVGEKGSVWLDLYNNIHVEIFSEGSTENIYPNSLLLQHGMIFYDYLEAKENKRKMINANLFDGIKTMELVFASYKSLECKSFVIVG